MPVHVTRKRGGVWYARGTVHVGSRSVIVPEFSTGCGARADADAVAAARDQEERQALLAGQSSRAARLTIADCLLSYLSRPGGIKPWDVARVAEFSELIGASPLTEAPAAWQTWLAERGTAQKPSSIARWRATLQAALNHGAVAANLPPPRLPSVRGAAGHQRIAFLTDDERTRLLAAYNPHAACPVLVMAYQGMRSQETLQLDWRQVDFDRRTLFIPAGQAKSGKGRTIPMHAKVDALLFGLWHAANLPRSGPMFRSSRGEPYADTRGRGERAQGGNPLTSAHETACVRAGVTGFRVHDWRHDWATRMVRAGVDLRTLMDLGGWSSMRMVAVYATVTAEGAAEAVARLR